MQTGGGTVGGRVEFYQKTVHIALAIPHWRLLAMRRRFPNDGRAREGLSEYQRGDVKAVPPHVVLEEQNPFSFLHLAIKLLIRRQILGAKFVSRCQVDGVLTPSPPRQGFLLLGLHRPCVHRPFRLHLIPFHLRGRGRAIAVNGPRRGGSLSEPYSTRPPHPMSLYSAAEALRSPPVLTCPLGRTGAWLRFHTRLPPRPPSHAPRPCPRTS